MAGHPRNHPVDVSRLSRANVPFVARTFCPIYVELHINQVGTSRMLAPKPSPGHVQGIPTIKFLCFFVYRFLFSLLLSVVLLHLPGEIFRAPFSCNLSQFLSHSFGSFSQSPPRLNHFKSSLIGFSHVSSQFFACACIARDHQASSFARFSPLAKADALNDVKL